MRRAEVVEEGDEEDCGDEVSDDGGRPAREGGRAHFVRDHGTSRHGRMLMGKEEEEDEELSLLGLPVVLLSRAGEIRSKEQEEKRGEGVGRDERPEDRSLSPRKE